jgi:hypothetical protein
MWLQRGCPEGTAEEDWLAAEQQCQWERRRGAAQALARLDGGPGDDEESAETGTDLKAVASSR